jgi:murein DD-endopeptidase MepM/ murein hydrolase activator NlpD
LSNKYYTLMIVPEKTSEVRKIILPAWLFKSVAAGLAFLFLLSIVMLLNYAYVMGQIGETKTLRIENRRMKQQVQLFRSKLSNIESTLDRVKTFSTRLKVITNLEDRSGLLQSLNNGKLPDAAANIGATASASAPGSVNPAATPAVAPSSALLSLHGNGPTGPAAQLNPHGNAPTAPAAQAPPSQVTAPAAAPVSSVAPLDDDAELQAENTRMSERFAVLNQDTLYVEQMLQDQYELLADRKAFLSALPVRRPAVGYFTSGFGVRTSPFGGRVKMHEGLDIANRPGTPIRAPADGLVTHSEARAGYGQIVVVDHGYGLETWYGHIRKSLVKRGQKVRRGDQIALLGNSGRSTGPHVHYEVRVNGTPVDPLSYILEN